jgi:aldose 1-epimerase
MSDHVLITLENACWQIGILPGTGGSIAYARLRHEGRWVDLLRPTPPAAYGCAAECSSFVLIPWASRIDKAGFRFRGIQYPLKSEILDGWAMHGIGRDYPWTVETVSAERAVLVFRSAEVSAPNFPFRFAARLEFRLEDTRLVIQTTLKNEDRCAMPGGFGHHPYFQRSLTGAPESVEMEIPCRRYFDLSAGVPEAAALPLPERLNFTQSRPIASVAIDDCLTDRDGAKPIRIWYPNAGREILFHADPVFQIVVCYTPPARDYFAVEPLTLATDAFNLDAKGIPGSGMFVLEPGEEKSGTIDLVAQTRAKGSAQ